MKNILQEYIPFEHENLDYINGLIAFARDQRQKNTAESVIAASTIYVNLVEYLVTHLLKNANHMVYLMSYLQFQSILYLKSYPKKFSSKPLGSLIQDLVVFEFPDKTEFTKSLNDFNKARINFIHKLFDKKTQEEIDKTDEDFNIIHEKAEEILQKYNAISQGLQSIWQVVTTPPSNEPKNDANERSKK